MLLNGPTFKINIYIKNNIWATYYSLVRAGKFFGHVTGLFLTFANPLYRLNKFVL